MNRTSAFVPRVAIGFAIAALASAFAASAQVPPKCLVVDTELQGTYEGGCKDGKANGKGTAVGQATYVGEFREGKKHGRGVKTWSWGDRYDGEFDNDTKQGWGTYTWGARSSSPGERYEGEYLNDKRHGFGVYTWASGDKYTGPWNEDALAGQPTPMMIARLRATTQALIAMAKPGGAKVCRETGLGIGLKERVEGTTQAVNGTTLQVSVKIEKLGEAALMIGGRDVRPGDTVWDDPLNWVLCN